MLSVEKEFEFICPAVHNVTLPIECAYLQSAPVGDTPFPKSNLFLPPPSLQKLSVWCFEFPKQF